MNSGKGFSYFSVITINKKQFEVILGKRCAFITNNYIASYCNQLKLYYFGRTRSIQNLLLFKKLYTWLTYLYLLDRFYIGKILSSIWIFISKLLIGWIELIHQCRKLSCLLSSRSQRQLRWVCLSSEY